MPQLPISERVCADVLACSNRTLATFEVEHHGSHFVLPPHRANALHLYAALIKAGSYERHKPFYRRLQIANPVIMHRVGPERPYSRTAYLRQGRNVRQSESQIRLDLPGQRPEPAMRTFDEYEKVALSTATHPAMQHDQKMVLLLGLAGEVGELLSEYKKRIRDDDKYSAFPERVAEELGDILWYVTATAHFFDLSLQDVVDRNVMKILDRWSPGAHGSETELPEPRKFDEPADEQFPRRLTIRVVQSEGEFGKVSRIFRDDNQLGQDLTDNSYAPDGYRLHDIFHLSYMAVLGWSPIARFFLGLKRKSMPAVAEVEDRGRGKVIDEGISALVFADARDHNFYEGVHVINHDLLRLIRRMVSHLEVSVCSEREWQSAILQGFEAWRTALRSDECLIHCDLDKRTIIAEKVL